MNEKTHWLKTWPEHFYAIQKGEKTAELRRNDRGFRVNDLLCLLEWDPVRQSFTGAMIEVCVGHVLTVPASDLVVLSLRFPVMHPPSVTWKARPNLIEKWQEQFRPLT